MSKPWTMHPQSLIEIFGTYCRKSGIFVALSARRSHDDAAPALLFTHDMSESDVPSGCKFIVLTGGPGAGKTAVLEFVRRTFEVDVALLPEAASIIFGGGFWRLESRSARNAAQRAIFHVQREMENLVKEEGRWRNAICDRGTLDGLAYWRGSEEEFWRMAHTTRTLEYARYHAVIHLRSPGADQGYNHSNPLRIETASEARAIDDRIAKIWSAHPKYLTVESSESFIAKAERALGLISLQIADNGS